MYIIIDVALVAVLILFLYFGYKQGFVKAGVGFLCFVLSFVLASALSPIISAQVYDGFISQRVISNVNSSMGENVLGVVKKTTAVMDGLPKFLTGSFGDYGISSAEVSKIIAKGQNPAEEISNLIKPIAQDMMSPIILLLITFILTFLSNFVIRKFRKVTKNLFVGKVDSVLGLAFGGLKYAILMAVVVVGIRAFMPIASKDIAESFGSLIDTTVVAKYFMNFDFNIIEGYMH